MNRKLPVLFVTVALVALAAGCNSSAPSGGKLAVNAARYESLMATATNTVILDFWAPWCGPCRTMAPVFEAVAAENPGVIFGKVNVDEEPALARKHQITGIPTIVAISNGKIAGTIVGAMDKKSLQAFVDEHAAKKP